MSITLEAVDLPESGRFELNIHQIVDIKVNADKARRLVTRYVSDYIGDLLYGEKPALVVLQDKRTVWRVPVAIATGEFGRIGQAGLIDVNVETGELDITEDLVHEIKDNAHRLVTRSPRKPGIQSPLSAHSTDK
jgi:hypothetical protein